MMVETLESANCWIPLHNMSCNPELGTPTAALIFILKWCLVALTVMSNLLVIVSISHFRQLHTPTNIILFSLAVSDLLVGLFVMPILTMLYGESCIATNQILCAVFDLTGYILTSSSVAGMVLLSVDRYVAICNPLHYSSMMDRRRVTITVALCCWICPVCFNVIILKHHFSQLDFSHYCHHGCAQIKLDNVVLIIDLLLTFVGPVTVIISLYIRVFAVAVSQARLMRSQISAAGSNTVIVKKSEMKAARTIGIIVFVFLMCLSPFYSASLGGDVYSGEGYYSSPQLWMFFGNSAFNPLVYAFFYRWFRKSVKIIVSLQILRPGSCEANIM